MGMEDEIEWLPGMATQKVVLSLKGTLQSFSRRVKQVLPVVNVGKER